jgi:hypothetical protein
VAAVRERAGEAHGAKTGRRGRLQVPQRAHLLRPACRCFSGLIWAALHRPHTCRA